MTDSGYSKAKRFPIGLQLYTVGAEMDADPQGTLQRVATAGYQQVESSPMMKMTARELRVLLDDVGLESPSGHYLLPDLIQHLDEKINDAKTLGQLYIVVTVPWLADLSRVSSQAANGPEALFYAVTRSLTLDDWKWNAEHFNRIGEAVKKVDLQLAFHNHNFEFQMYGPVSGYDEFLRLTDPDLVKLQLDCGWMSVAGRDPVAYLEQYPDRYKLLHIKDFRHGFQPTTILGQEGPGCPVPTEVGSGAVDYRPILRAAQDAKVSALFVEQEPPFTDMPALDAIQVDYDFVRSLLP